MEHILPSNQYTWLKTNRLSLGSSSSFFNKFIYCVKLNFKNQHENSNWNVNDVGRSIFFINHQHCPVTEIGIADILQHDDAGFFYQYHNSHPVTGFWLALVTWSRCDRITSLPGWLIIVSLERKLKKNNRGMLRRIRVYCLDMHC